VKFNSKIC